MRGGGKPAVYAYTSGVPVGRAPTRHSQRGAQVVLRAWRRVPGWVGEEQGASPRGSGNFPRSLCRCFRAPATDRFPVRPPARRSQPGRVLSARISQSRRTCAGRGARLWLYGRVLLKSKLRCKCPGPTFTHYGVRWEATLKVPESEWLQRPTRHAGEACAGLRRRDSSRAAIPP